MAVLEENFQFRMCYHNFLYFFYTRELCKKSSGEFLWYPSRQIKHVCA